MSMTFPVRGVSGPGKFSVREDLPPAEFQGDRSQTQEILSGAPTAKTPDVRPTPAGEVRAAAQQAPRGPLPNLFAPTENRDEDIMTPLPAMAPAQGKLSDTLATLLPYDTTGEISILYQMAISRGQ